MPSIKRLTAITALTMAVAVLTVRASNNSPGTAQAATDGTRQTGITVGSPAVTFGAPLTLPGFANPGAPVKPEAK